MLVAIELELLATNVSIGELVSNVSLGGVLVTGGLWNVIRGTSGILIQVSHSCPELK